MEYDELLHALRDVLQGHAGVDFAVLFGSWARREAWSQSDVDVAVMPQGNWPLATELDLQGRLSHAVAATVDLVRLDRADLVLAWQVIREGRLIAGAADRWALYHARIALDHADAAPVLERAARQYARRVAELGVPK